MNWIKKHYDQFALALFAVALLAVSIVIILNTRDFGTQFAQKAVGKKESAPALEMAAVKEAQVALKKPVLWTLKDNSGSLFVAERHIIDPLTKLPRPLGGGEGESIHPPVPDKWILKYSLDLLSGSVLQEDPDKDGFTTLEEYLGTDRSAANKDADSTSPVDAKSHPAYYTKLFLKSFIKVRFRLLFNAYDGDPKRDKVENMSFQINTVDLRQPTEFLKIGETVKNTRFKVMKFEYKTALNPKTGEDDDVSELTVLNTETEESVILIMTKVTDSPDSYALFHYSFPQPAMDIRVKKLGEFVLKPDIGVKYKLIDIKETEALIALPSGEKYTVPILPR